MRLALAEAVRRWAPQDAIAETGAGDSVLMAAADPVALAQTARHLMDAVYSAPGQPRLRIALHHGTVQTRLRDLDLRPTIAGGAAILCAARLEPLVEPGQIWATDAFREQFLQRPSLWRMTRWSRRPAVSSTTSASRDRTSPTNGCGCTVWPPDIDRMAGRRSDRRAAAHWLDVVSTPPDTPTHPSDRNHAMQALKPSLRAAAALLLTAVASAVLAQPQAADKPDAAASAAAPLDKRVPQPRSAGEVRDAATPPGELRPENPVVPQIGIPLGRPAVTMPLTPERQARAQRAAAANGVDDAAARCMAQSKVQDRATCRPLVPKSAASAPKLR